ncbi:MAG: hypothetical protein Q7S58_19475 [Candidatus Binatus sp.]|nr:hypothetical protein [Candidatus Binatus sp.]
MLPRTYMIDSSRRISARSRAHNSACAIVPAIHLNAPLSSDANARKLNAIDTGLEGKRIAAKSYAAT